MSSSTQLYSMVNIGLQTAQPIQTQSNQEAEVESFLTNLKSPACSQSSDPLSLMLAQREKPEQTPDGNSALEVQIGGSHYKDMTIQPVEYIHANNIPFLEGCVIKYVSRWKSKGGIQDLQKAKHFIDLLIDLESRTANKAQVTEQNS